MDKQSSYSQTRERLEEIVTQIRAKDLPLEKSLDLYEEALRLGSSCAEMIDRTDFSADELEGNTLDDSREGDDKEADEDDDDADASDTADEDDEETDETDDDEEEL